MNITPASPRNTVFSAAPIDGPMVIEPTVFNDDRGCFLETYQIARYASVGITDDFLQDNYSRSRRNVIRGLHTQAGQSKLVRCVRGAIYDVVVDLRPGSPTAGKWHSVILTGDSRLQLYVPQGFAHGFLSMGLVDAEVEYKCSSVYAPALERSLAWNDPTIGIRWPLAGQDPILSGRDQAALTLREHQAE